MLLVGSDDGVYALPGPDESADVTDRLTSAGEADGSSGVVKTLSSGRAMRLRQFDGLPGVFAATASGLIHSPDGDNWIGLGVPEPKVYAVGATLDGERLYAGTRPAAVYATDVFVPGDRAPTVDWRELDGFQDLPSREEWRLPRHEDLAQVRDVTADPADPDRVVAGVEVGGVHVSDDRGETWTERRSDVNDDVHELHVVGPGEYVAATGFGLFRTRDAGQSWTRLDEAVDQRYFRRVFSLGETVYAAGALASSASWDDPDADPALFAVRDDALTQVGIPDEAGTVTGMAAVDGDLVAATHRGSLFAVRGNEVQRFGAFPVPDDATGSYTPVAWLPE
ncbi:hypothetical protein SAMN05216559_0207 [Halomicrobium zhouii]|uniref:Uncharacterized protein n=1 Tax=Halomicrobium zhouii TaxID=767519 RepID=A0A1I6K5I4_9EURY|nr:hypothetical protein [Halomicrobium zhouii]SFR86338.1 hypothetical protein SAMN05216559_0207 [Halomicrobium zhouii]